MRQKIYIAGAGGMLGEAFYHLFKAYHLKCTDINTTDPWMTFCDVRDYDSYRKSVLSFGPDYLFHLAAHTSLEYCETNPKDAFETNTKSVEYACKIANELDIPILYISTAGIFDGKKEFYEDDDEPNPIGIYAKSKYEGELIVKNYAKRYLICRAGWMMGGGFRKDKKFVKKICMQLLQGAQEIYVVKDKLGTPTYTYDFAANTKLLLEENIWGLFNMVNEGQTDRKEVATEILEILGLQNTVRLVEVPSSYFANTYFAPRPYSERLVNKKLHSLKKNIMRDWRMCLREYLTTSFKELFPQ